MKSDAPKSEENAHGADTRVYFAAYFFTFLVDGFLFGFPGSLFEEFKLKLDTSTLTMSWIYASMSIGYIAANIGFGYIADRVVEVHRVQSVLMFIVALCLGAIPFTESIPVMFVLFTIAGVGLGGNETHFTLLIFRLYAMDGSRMFLFILLLNMVSCGLTPLIIQFSIAITSSYAPPFVLCGIMSMIHSVSILFLPTPRHDELRALKRQVSAKQITANTDHKPDGKPVSDHQSDQTEDNPKSPEGPFPTESSPPPSSVMEVDDVNVAEFAKSASMRLQDDTNYLKLQNATIVLLQLTMMTTGMLWRGVLAFITTYCSEYLHVDDQYGRYLMSLFFWFGILYRLIALACFPNAQLGHHVLASYASEVVMITLFILFGDNLTVLFVLYCAIGFCSGIVPPGLCAWAENIKPTTGLIACLWWVMFGIGDAIITFVMGALIDEYGARIMPMVLLGPVIAGLLLSMLSMRFYKELRAKEDAVIELVQCLSRSALSNTTYPNSECSVTMEKSPTENKDAVGTEVVVG